MEIIRDFSTGSVTVTFPLIDSASRPNFKTGGNNASAGGNVATEISYFSITSGLWVWTNAPDSAITEMEEIRNGLYRLTLSGTWLDADRRSEPIVITVKDGGLGIDPQMIILTHNAVQGAVNANLVSVTGTDISDVDDLKADLTGVEIHLASQDGDIAGLETHLGFQDVVIGSIKSDTDYTANNQDSYKADLTVGVDSNVTSIDGTLVTGPGDLKADVSALATQASVDSMQADIDAIVLKLPDGTISGLDLDTEIDGTPFGEIQKLNLSRIAGKYTIERSTGSDLVLWFGSDGVTEVMAVEVTENGRERIR